MYRACPAYSLQSKFSLVSDEMDKFEPWVALLAPSCLISFDLKLKGAKWKMINRPAPSPNQMQPLFGDFTTTCQGILQVLLKPCWGQHDALRPFPLRH